MRDASPFHAASRHEDDDNRREHPYVMPQWWGRLGLDTMLEKLAVLAEPAVFAELAELAELAVSAVRGGPNEAESLHNQKDP